MIHGRGPDAITATSVARERDALKWLFSFADMERGVGWNRDSDPAEAWKLGRTRALLDLAGAPDRRMRCALIAGTKGKGSTAAFLAALLHAGGVRAGLYTQPHLQSYRERIRVDGVMMDADAFAAAVEPWHDLVDAFRARYPEAGSPTTFELTTALALAHFAARGCAVAVLEVGLGGRLDATNATEPEVSVLTTIDRGHTDILGTRLEQIAREKAGILRRGRVALVAQQRPSVRRALVGACRTTAAQCRWVDPLPTSTPLSLSGLHQRQNAALAVAAAAELGVRGAEHALRELRWPGRIETLEGGRMVLDGAHDPASARALADELRARGVGSVKLVIGMYRDKEAARILRPLMPLASRVWVTAPAGPRALPASELARVCRRLGGAPIEVREDVASAMDAARDAAGEGTVVVTGSLALVGQARDHLGLEPVERLWS
jgi:dihydrofolate synthase/folylpolyglutamate synthase